MTLSSMWTSVLVLAMAVNFEPIRIGLITLMLSGPRPMLQLLAFITGSFAMSISVGFPVLFVFHHGLFGVTNTDGSKAQIVIGVLILLIAVLLTTNFPAGRFARRPTTPMEKTPLEQPPMEKLRARSLLQGGSPWFSGVMGMSAALPSVDYMALLVLIARLGGYARGAGRRPSHVHRRRKRVGGNPARKLPHRSCQDGRIIGQVP